MLVDKALLNADIRTPMDIETASPRTGRPWKTANSSECNTPSSKADDCLFFGSSFNLDSLASPASSMDAALRPVTVGESPGIL